MKQLSTLAIHLPPQLQSCLYNSSNSSQIYISTCYGHLRLSRGHRQDAFSLPSPGDSQQYLAQWPALSATCLLKILCSLGSKDAILLRLSFFLSGFSLFPLYRCFLLFRPLNVGVPRSGPGLLSLLSVPFSQGLISIPMTDNSQIYISNPNP